MEKKKLVEKIIYLLSSLVIVALAIVIIINSVNTPGVDTIITSSLNSENSEHNVSGIISNEVVSEEVSSTESEVSSLPPSSLPETESSDTEFIEENIIPPEGMVCYLTFDDGPSKNTLSILETLDKYNAKATFFIIGQSNLEYVKNIHEAGHTVGLHSNTHAYDKIYKSTSAYLSDLEALDQKVYEQIGIHSKIIRFPGGGSNTVSRKYCKGIMSTLSKEVQRRGYKYFDWNVSSGDAVSTKNLSGENLAIVNGVKMSSKSYIMKNIKREIKDSNGKLKTDICVLMHDAAGKATTAQVLPEMLEYLSSLGYRFEALNETSPNYHHDIAN